MSSLALTLSLVLSQVAAEPAAAPTSVAQAPATPWWQKVSLNGFARIDLGYTFPLKDQQLVGSNGGFRVADFRLGLDFTPVERLLVSTSIELAAPLIDPNDPLAGRRIVELRDAFVEYELCRGAVVKAGQFRPGYYAEMLLSDGALPFTARSILANGVNPPDGYGPRAPLAPDRQIGLQLASRRLGDAEGLGLKYAVGLFNGNGPNALFNDNNTPMPVVRVEGDYHQWVTLGLNASYNVSTTGTRPNQLTTTSLNYGADVTVKVEGFSAMVGFLGRSNSYGYAGLPSDLAWGLMGQVRYQHEATGLEAAVRYAQLEPSTAQTDDQVSELTAMVGWRPFHLPFRVLLQYAHRGEETAVSYPNDGVDLMLHATW